MEFLRYKELKGKIVLLSGLHIGGNKDKIEIGGIDNPVIKNPITGLPYIPGSSIKGKMRFLLEWKLGKVTIAENGKPHSCSSDDGTCLICRIFGNTAKDKKYGPTRLIVSDCSLILNEDEIKQHKKGEFICLEDKVENRINRLTGTAIDPRHIERVPAGMIFNFGLTYKVFKIDSENENDTSNKDEQNWQQVLDALYYLQEDALGGSGSRGYGKIKFDSLMLDNSAVELQWNRTNAILSPVQNVGV